MAISKTSTAGRFLTHVIPAVLRPLRILWNEMIGFIFFVFGVWAIPSTIRAWKDFDAGLAPFSKVLLPAIFALVMCGYGIHAFWRARKISKT